MTQFTGVVEIATSQPTDVYPLNVRVVLDGDTGNVEVGGHGADGDVALRNSGGEHTIRFAGAGGDAHLGGNGSDGSLFVKNAAGDETIRLNAREAAGQLGGGGLDGTLTLKDATGQPTALLHGDRGSLQLNDTWPESEPSARSQAARIDIASRWGDWIFLRQSRDQRVAGGFLIHNPWGNSDQPQGNPERNRLDVAYRTVDGRDLWNLLTIHGPTGNVGLGTGQPLARLHVEGDVIVTGDINLVGADVAEQFSLVESGPAEPGTVMVLDSEGAVRSSAEAYDRRVAGVVTGALGQRPGIVLNKQGHEQGQATVALVGTVYCKVDATYGPIRVGDMVTTSDTPGHAMRVVDLSRAFGTTLGKALRSQPSGTGLIPVLVGLR